MIEAEQKSIDQMLRFGKRKANCTEQAELQTSFQRTENQGYTQVVNDSQDYS